MARLFERKFPMENMKDSRRDREQSEKMATLGRLVSAVVHEINTPVGAINSNNDLLARMLPLLREHAAGESEESRKKKLTDLVGTLTTIAEVDRMALRRIVDLVRNVKNFSRRDRAERVPFKLQEGLDTTVRLVEWQFKGRIRIEKTYGDLPKIRCFPNRLNQAFLNLLVNAGEAIEGRGVITIATRIEGDNVVVEFSDTGKGIPREQREKIFEADFTTKDTGTGLGLSTTREIVREHGGTIEVESEMGKGTVFRINLPVN